MYLDLIIALNVQKRFDCYLRDLFYFLMSDAGRVTACQLNYRPYGGVELILLYCSYCNNGTLLKSYMTCYYRIHNGSSTKHQCHITYPLTP